MIEIEVNTNGTAGPEYKGSAYFPETGDKGKWGIKEFIEYSIGRVLGHPKDYGMTTDSIRYAGNCPTSIVALFYCVYGLALSCDNPREWIKNGFFDSAKIEDLEAGDILVDVRGKFGHIYYVTEILNDAMKLWCSNVSVKGCQNNFIPKGHLFTHADWYMGLKLKKGKNVNNDSDVDNPSSEVSGALSPKDADGEGKLADSGKKSRVKRPAKHSSRKGDGDSDKK